MDQLKSPIVGQKATADSVGSCDNSRRPTGNTFPALAGCQGIPLAEQLTFQSSEVTSLLLGTSWPPSRMQCLRTSCVEPPELFSLRFQIRAVESPDLHTDKRYDPMNK